MWAARGNSAPAGCSLAAGASTDLLLTLGISPWALRTHPATKLVPSTAELSGHFMVAWGADGERAEGRWMRVRVGWVHSPGSSSLDGAVLGLSWLSVGDNVERRDEGLPGRVKPPSPSPSWTGPHLGDKRVVRTVGGDEAAPSDPKTDPWRAWPLMTPSVPPSYGPGCALGLGRTSQLRSCPLPCPDGPGLTPSVAGEDNGPCCRPAAPGHILRGPSDPEQGL